MEQPIKNENPQKSEEETKAELEAQRVKEKNKMQERINSARQTQQQLQFHFKKRYAFTRGGKTKRS